MDLHDVRAVVHQQIRTYLPHLAEADIVGGAHLKDLGADSVERLEIILAIVDRLGIRVPLERFSDIPCVDALVEFVAGARADG